MHPARPQRAEGALEDPQCFHNVPTARCLTPSRGVSFKHIKNKRRCIAFYEIAQCFYSVGRDCTARACDLQLFLNAMETLWGRRSGVTGLYVCIYWVFVFCKKVKIIEVLLYIKQPSYSIILHINRMHFTVKAGNIYRHNFYGSVDYFQLSTPVRCDV